MKTAPEPGANKRNPGGGVRSFPTCMAVWNIICAAAQQRPTDENKVKAGFLVNFPNFIEWPEKVFPGNAEAFTICIPGEDPFGDSIPLLSDKRIAGRRVLFRNIAKPEEASSCQILFIGSSNRKDTGAILRTLHNKPVLTVGEHKGFCQSGGMINRVTVNRKLRFEINPRAARQANLVIGSQLLNLALDIVE